MDSFSITTDCIELGNTISRASLGLNEFVREVRESRADLGGVSRELHSLQIVLDLLKDDAGTLPSRLAAETPALLQQCNRVVGELDACLLVLDGRALSRTQKRSQWISFGVDQIASLKMALEAHRALIELALDLVGATIGRDLHDSMEQGDLDTAENEQRRTEVRTGVLKVVEEMAQLRRKMAAEFALDGPNSCLSSYYVALKMYANSLVYTKDSEDGAYLGDGALFGAYLGDSPDSAIEVNDGSSFKAFGTPPAAESPALSAKAASQYVHDVNQLMSEMIDVPSRAPTPPPKDLKRLASQRNTMVSPFELLETNPEHVYGVVTEISSQGRKVTNRPPPASSGRLGRLFGHVKNALSEAPSGVPSTSSSSSEAARPATPIMQASLVRRGSRRLSTSIKRLPLWNIDLEEPEGPPSPGSNAIFGVSLSKSMQAAKSTAKTHHNGSGGSSRREFPLCMYKCCSFLQLEAIDAPDIFAEPGDGYRVQKLKEIFSQAPKYGEDINWDNFGVYDAADIILLFLSQLPKPLISEALVKRWISLSRQATLSGSLSTRIDQCIDFWEEALGGMRGPSRSLFKLLLNLWSAIVDAAEKNEMTAERLAAVLLKPLMHTSSEKYSTDYMLALAFLIRRRSEYVMMMDEGRASRAAW